MKDIAFKPSVVAVGNDSQDANVLHSKPNKPTARYGSL